MNRTYTLLLLLTAIFAASCRDEMVTDAGTGHLTGKKVQVEICLEPDDLADGYDLLPHGGGAGTRSVNSGAVDVQLLSANAQTRTGEAGDVMGTAKPDCFYELHVMQVTKGGSKTLAYYSGKTELGKKTLLTLVADDDSQLVIYARGGEAAESASAGGGFAVTNWETYSVPANWINGIETEADMRKMPYYLHLEHVKIIADAESGKGIIQSLDGQDARLRLRRLASRVQVSWDYRLVEGYTLQEVTLHDIPMKFLAFPSHSEDTYPNLIEQFTTRKLALKASDADDINVSGTSVWIPRNVRGTVNISLPTRRGKGIAPQGSSYLRFVATNNADPKRKLIYRVYLGANNTSDFNIRDNTNYNYKVTFAAHDESIYQRDDRVDLLNGVRASENNDNFVPTANCFMVKPGGSFCFDPYMFRVDGQDVENTVMAGYSATISKVALLWQTKEDGDVGEPVLGIANSLTDHSNIVDIKNTDGTPAPYTKGKARIYCRVAHTKGGSGVIAAYDTNGRILWSWHVWVTDYNPDATGTETVLEPESKRKLLYAYNTNASWKKLPMMDRNLGAHAGYLDDAPSTPLAMSKANGFHYQWGRKDPYPSSYSAKTIGNINDRNSDTPPEGMLNRYGPDGYTYYKNEASSNTAPSLQVACQNPNIFYAKGGKGPEWCNQQNSGLWGNTSGKKTVWDPSPAGWRVASYIDYYSVFESGSCSISGSSNLLYPQNSKNKGTLSADGGVLLYFQQKGSGHSSYYRFTGYGRYSYTFEYIGVLCTIWCRDSGSAASAATALRLEISGNAFKFFEFKGMYSTDAHPLRCIQERED